MKANQVLLALIQLYPDLEPKVHLLGRFQTPKRFVMRSDLQSDELQKRKGIT